MHSSFIHRRIANRVLVAGLLGLLLISPSWACTIFTASMKGEVLAGANEDYDNPFSKVWFNPSAKGRYGTICFGFPDLQSQAAINEHGLFFDFTAIGLDPAQYPLKNPYYGSLFLDILGQCRNVPEALEFLQTHDYPFSSQALLADAEGNSVIINAGSKVKKTGHYQISTNFNVCQLATKQYSCGRYDIADQMLSQAQTISVPFFRQILSLTHQEGGDPTQYSMICDLKRGIVSVYLYHNYEQAYQIDIKRELQKGYRVENLADHFAPSFAYQSWAKRHPEYGREVFLSEVAKQGLDQTLTRYQGLTVDPAAKDSVNTLLMDAGMVFLRRSYGQYSTGNRWLYLYQFPQSYAIWHSTDANIQAASRLFGSVVEQGCPKGLEAVTYELVAYTNLVQNKVALARQYYEKSLAIAPPDSPTSKRGRAMLAQLN